MYAKLLYPSETRRIAFLLHGRPKQWSWKLSCSTTARHQRSCYSSQQQSTNIAFDDNDARIMSKLGLGSHQWAKLDSSIYNQVVRTALENRIDTIEAGPEGGSQALATAYQAALDENPQLEQRSITFLVRIGYRTVAEGMSISVPDSLPNDVKVEEFTFDPAANPVGMAKPLTPSTDAAAKARVFHNIGSEAVSYALESCPLLKLAKEHSCIRILPLLHNPEVQGSQLGAPMLERQSRICEMLTQGFETLEDYIQHHPSTMHSYGVVSNGVCLPNDHPLYLNYQTVLEATKAISVNNHKSHFSVLQLPINVLERKGFDIAKAAKKEWSAATADAASDSVPLHIYGMRPLTCYPDLGTGSGHPILLADYLLPVEQQEPEPADDANDGVWTNETKNAPAAYQTAFRTAMAYFDADDLLHRKVSNGEDSLTDEERETLAGCQLLQSLLQDLDAGLEQLRSLAAHQSVLYERVIPIIHETFSEMDAETAQLLEQYFQAYSLAVRYAIAKNTRKLIVSGEQGSNAPKCKDLTPETRLQEYGLRFALKHEHGVIDKVVIGSSSPEQVVDNIYSLYKAMEDETPI
ncbi:hypothetical protein MPSEU_000020500 [Mayamaea pseudoterrestris]|nr:hypothetical protein MPSEU_000020500 [Mayamaea pseudoterrestris]